MPFVPPEPGAPPEPLPPFPPLAAPPEPLPPLAVAPPLPTAPPLEEPPEPDSFVSEPASSEPGDMTPDVQPKTRQRHNPDRVTLFMKLPEVRAFADTRAPGPPDVPSLKAGRIGAHTP